MRRRERPAERAAARRLRGGRARRDGRAAEILAAAWLMLKGWRILAMRLRTPEAEIDLLARKGAVLAVVEVKARRTLLEALEAVTPDQRDRLRRAGERFAAKWGGGSRLNVRLDMVALAPGRRPRHIADAWPASNSWSGR